MPGKGPPPAVNRRRHNAPARGDWVTVPGIGWQHGEPPKPPPRLLAASRAAWQVWFRSWYSAHWSLADLAGLRVVIRIYDQVERGNFGLHKELRQWSDTFGITPKGQMDRRWHRPGPAETPSSPSQPPPSTYQRLRGGRGD